MKRPIPGFPGYFVTDAGQIWSEPRRDNLGRRVTGGRWLTLGTRKNGYSRVHLRRNGRDVNKYVHHLVLEAFVGPRPKGMEACHFPDQTRTNNHLSNLRWDTRSENMRDAVLCGTRGGEADSQTKLTAENVRAIDALYRTGSSTQKEIAKQYGVSRVTVTDIVNRHTWKHLWPEVTT